MTRDTRASNFELLRIVSMYLIVWNHFFTHGAWVNPSVQVNVVVQTFSLGKVGVNIFVMITGYFMYGRPFRSRSFFRTAGLTLFWSLVFCLLGVFGGRETAVLGLKGVDSWFVIIYLCLYLLIPFLNVLAGNLSRRDYRLMLCIVAAIGSLAPTILPSSTLGQGVLGSGTQLPWFCFLYLLAAYIRKYDVSITPHKLALITMASFMLLVCSRAPVTYFYETSGNSIRVLEVIQSKNHDANYLPVLAVAASVFLCFKEWQVPSNPTINKIASTTFGIYLIHDNPLVRTMLWPLFAGLQSNAGMLLLVSAPICLAVFAACAIIELARSSLFARVTLRPHVLDDLCEKLDAAMRIEPLGD